MWSWLGTAIKTATTWTKNAVNVVDKIVNPVAEPKAVVSTPTASSTAKKVGWKVKYNDVTDELGNTL